ncbi:hypothetical protein D3C86_1770600 [compost metagenome]
MPDTAPHRSIDQIARGRGIVRIVFKRIGHGFRHHYGAGKVHDFRNVMFVDQAVHQVDVTGMSPDKNCPPVDSPLKTGYEIVEHHDGFASIGEIKHHVASDIAGAAGDQYCHVDLLNPV